MSNELGLAVKPVTSITPEDELRVANWINTEEYKMKNFARQALVINPAHACQPLGAELAAHGFEGTLPFVHGSQGCASYYRSTLNRHFREPAPAVSDSMTEDGAVFGGQNNLHEGLENAVALYKPKMIAVFTSCMPEIIGDDLTAFVKNARQRDTSRRTSSFPSRTHPRSPARMSTATTRWCCPTCRRSPRTRRRGAMHRETQFFAGFDTNTGNYREYKRIFKDMGIPYTVLADISESFDSPNDGKYRLYPGGTPLLEAADWINGKATLTVGPYPTQKTFTWIREQFAGAHLSLPMPMGIAKTDGVMLRLCELFDKSVPETLKAERGRAVDAMTDSQQYIHGKKFALYGDADLLLGYVSFLLEMGAVPYHILCSKGSKKLEKEIQALLETSPYGKQGKIYMNRDLWHLRSLLVTDPVDALIGDTHGKFAARDAKIRSSGTVSPSLTG